MVSRWRFLATFLRPAFPASRMQQVSDLHFKFALRPHHVWSMVDIQSTAAEIRRGKKKEERRRKIEITGQKYNGLPYYIGRPITEEKNLYKSLITLNTNAQLLSCHTVATLVYLLTPLFFFQHSPCKGRGVNTVEK